jgi:hypothetical protein
VLAHQSIPLKAMRFPATRKRCCPCIANTISALGLQLQRVGALLDAATRMKG